MTTFEEVERLWRAQGIAFACPACYRDHGFVDPHFIVCWNRWVSDEVRPGPGRWVMIGTSMDDLTLHGSPGKDGSISTTAPSGCKARFWVVDGKIEFA